jgi:hypothetical protein
VAVPEDKDALEALPSHGAHEPLGHAVRPWGANWVKGTRMSIAPLDHVLSASRSFDL